jgi:prepilin-type N-terminal cleavage/methylation domain-containing protein
LGSIFVIFYAKRRCVMRRRKGFTLMELIIVVIIIGILAMIGLPQYFKTTERARMAEALDTLGAIRSAELRWAMSNGAGNSTGNWADLDIDQINATTNFNAPALTGGAACNGTTNTVVASVQRNGKAPNDYKVAIACGGALTCAAGTCPPLPQ